MPRLSSSKGQWFIVAAVFVSGIFLTISTMLSSFAPVESSVFVYRNEDYFSNILNLKTVEIMESCDSDWSLELNSLINSSRSYLEEYGYLLDFDPPSSCSDTDYKIEITTNEMYACSGYGCSS